MKVILNKTKNSSERHTLISGSMGSAGEPATSPNHKFKVANGVDRGNGYQGYMAVSYFLNGECYAPKEAVNKCKKILQNLGYKL